MLGELPGRVGDKDDAGTGGGFAKQDTVGSGCPVGVGLCAGRSGAEAVWGGKPSAEAPRGSSQLLRPETPGAEGNWWGQVRGGGLGGWGWGQSCQKAQLLPQARRVMKCLAQCLVYKVFNMSACY